MSLPYARALQALLAGAALFILYFFGLTRTGLLSTDEPRYASIGRDMAATGDWITPRLWGEPWFEKPALLYWMTAAGYRLGLPDDLAPRLPVAAASVAFLLFFWWTLRREYDQRVAAYAVTILATSAGWLAYSHIAVTDLPLSVCLSASLLLLWSGRGSGLLLGLAVLAKGLVPYVLFLPAIWAFRHRWRYLTQVIGISILTASIWYVPMLLIHGRAFFDDFFLKQHFARFSTETLQHVQPWWFYIPVVGASFFPWSPLLTVLLRPGLFADRRECFLLAWFGFGFVFFSASRNKLPGYILPLLPPMAILLALGLARAKSARWMLALSAALLWLIPPIAELLPQALTQGLSRSAFHFNPWLLVPMIAMAALVWRAPLDLGLGAIALAMLAFVGYLTWTTYPILDQTVSARSYFRANPNVACVEEGRSRSWRYSLNYYAKKNVPDCN